MLYALLAASCLLPIIPGIILAKKTGFSPHWFWLSVIPFVGFMIMLIMYINSPVSDTSKTQEEKNSERKKKQKIAFVAIMTIAFLGGIPLWLGTRKSIEEYEPYIHTMELLKNDREVQSYLGDEIKRTFGYICKTAENGNGSETVDLFFTIKGSKAKGNVSVNAYKKNEKWFYDSIMVNAEASGTINLVE